MTTQGDRSRPAPTETDKGAQQDDNLDDTGHRPDGSEQDQPTNPGEKSKDNGKR